MTSMTRRQLMGTAAMAAVAAGMAGRTTLAQGSADKAAIDQVLRQAADARQVPGVVAVAATDKGDDWEAYLQSVADKHAPIKRFATPEELADFFVFLCSDRASYSVGSTYFVDGGMLKTL